MSAKAEKNAARQARLAKALRDNLGRRKAQARGRARGTPQETKSTGGAGPSNGHKDNR